MADVSLYERLVVWNERRIEQRRLKKPFLPTEYGFEYKGIASQFRAEWEPHDRAVICELLPSVARFVNVGAHYGYYVCLAASKNVPVIAVEPIDANFKMLLDNVDHNNFGDRVRLVHGAAGAEPAIATITGAFSGGTLTGNSAKPASMNQRTPVWKLSELIPEIDDHTLVLMDVEGYEYEALLGAERGLVNSAKVSWVIEVSPHVKVNGVREKNPNFLKMLNLMAEQGYAFWPITENMKQYSVEELEAMMDKSQADMPGGNYLCMAPHVAAKMLPNL